MKSFCLLISFGLWISHIQSQYHTYDSPYNQIAQSIIRTSDQGFLIASIESCYTPEEWVIEGCPVGIQLLKTDNTGDSMWLKEIVNFDILGPIHLFENEDGTYTIFAMQDGNYMCKEWTIGPDFGLPQVIIYHVDEAGELLFETGFPDECQLELLSVERLSDTTFVLLTKYSEPFASDTTEGNLLIMDHKGKVSEQLTFPGDPYLKGDLMIDSNRILVFHVDTNNDAKLNVYDSNLNVIQSSTNTHLDSTCLVLEDTRASVVILENGDIFVMCDNPFNKGKNVELSTFSPKLNVISDKEYSIPFGSGFIVNEKHEIIILSESRTKEDSSDIKLTFFNTMGDSLYARGFRIPGNQSPTQIITLHGDEMAVVGTHNCCNLSKTIGPGDTFLYLGDLFTSISNTDNREKEIKIFPNPARDLVQIKFDKVFQEFGEPEVYIYSATGLLMEKMKLTGEDAISLSKLEAGTYILVFEIDNLIVKREKLVKIY